MCGLFFGSRVSTAAEKQPTRPHVCTHAPRQYVRRNPPARTQGPRCRRVRRAEKWAHVSQHQQPQPDALFVVGCPARQRKPARPARLFRSIEEVPRPSQVVLSVFFRQIDVGLSLRSFYTTLSELNPQIAEDVIALHSSGPILMNVICVNSRWQASFRDSVISGLTHLPESNEGKSLLSIFGVEGHKPFRDEYLDSLRRLLRDSSPTMP